MNTLISLCLCCLYFTMLDQGFNDKHWWCHLLQQQSLQIIWTVLECFFFLFFIFVCRFSLWYFTGILQRRCHRHQNQIILYVFFPWALPKSVLLKWQQLLQHRWPFQYCLSFTMSTIPMDIFHLQISILGTNHNITSLNIKIFNQNWILGILPDESLFIQLSSQSNSMQNNDKIIHNHGSDSVSLLSD